MSAPDPARYRPCAGIMLANREGRVFVGQRLDAAVEAWQMPQGGIDPGEDARAAALRELGEETGISPHLVEVLAELGEELYYDLPAELAKRLWKGRYLGQRQRWFLLRFLGQDGDVAIATAHPEFRAWRWAAVAELAGLAVPFKRALYERVVAGFAPLLAPGGGPGGGPGVGLADR